MWWPHSSYTEKNSFDKEIFFELLLYNIKKRIVVLTNIFIDRCLGSVHLTLFNSI